MLTVAEYTMDILFFTHYYPPEGNAPASRVSALARAWAAAGHGVTVVTCVPNVPNGVVYEGYRNRLLQTERMDGVEVVRVWTYMAPNKGTVRRIANYLSFLLTASLFGLFRKADIVAATSPQFFSGWAGAIVAKLRRKPFVLEIRDLWPESIVAVGANLSTRTIRFLEWLERKLYAAADHIVTVGEGYRGKLLDKGVSADKLSIVMNGVDKTLFRERDRPSDLAEQWQVGNRYVCGYIGTIGMACGLRTVLEAAGTLKEKNIGDIVFLLIGDGAERAALEREARERGLDNVIFAGRQPKESIPDFLALCDGCLVHLKKSDLFKTVMPSKIFEAAAMKRPIIMGVEGCARELVLKAGAGLTMEPENANELVECVLRLKENPREAQRLGESGYAYFTEHFDRDRQAETYLAILRRVRDR